MERKIASPAWENVSDSGAGAESLVHLGSFSPPTPLIYCCCYRWFYLLGLWVTFLLCAHFPHLWCLSSCFT